MKHSTLICFRQDELPAVLCVNMRKHRSSGVLTRWYELVCAETVPDRLQSLGHSFHCGCYSDTERTDEHTSTCGCSGTTQTQAVGNNLLHSPDRRETPVRDCQVNESKQCEEQKAQCDRAESH